jgi:hypothetical protein
LILPKTRKVLLTELRSDSGIKVGQLAIKKIPPSLLKRQQKSGVTKRSKHQLEKAFQQPKKKLEKEKNSTA